MPLPDTVRRAVRTFVQAFLGSLLVLLPTDLVMASTMVREVLVAAGWAATISLLTFLHNELEDAGRLPDTRASR
jgi:hypothetical protein